jgi:hypothetical protein
VNRRYHPHFKDGERNSIVTKGGERGTQVLAPEEYSPHTQQRICPVSKGNRVDPGFVRRETETMYCCSWAWDHFFLVASVMWNTYYKTYFKKKNCKREVWNIFIVYTINFFSFIIIRI